MLEGGTVFESLSGLQNPFVVLMEVNKTRRKPLKELDKIWRSLLNVSEDMGSESAAAGDACAKGVLYRLAQSNPARLRQTYKV